MSLVFKSTVVGMKVTPLLRHNEKIRHAKSICVKRELKRCCRRYYLLHCNYFVCFSNIVAHQT